MSVRRIWNQWLSYVVPRYQVLSAAPVLLKRPYQLYLYNNWHNGDVIFSRPLYQKIIESQLFDLVIGVYQNAAYLLEDLVAQGVTLHISSMKDSGKGCAGDLAYMCPSTHTAVHTWLGQYPDTHPHTWQSTVTVFNRLMQLHKMDFEIPYLPEDTPMVRFPSQKKSVLANAVYVENGHTRSEHSDFIFDFQTMAQQFSHFNFYCTAPIKLNLSNVHVCAHENLVGLSAISEQCIAILGKGSGPFLCTYTEKNRFKPRAVCGYDTNRWAPFWDYPNNPLQYFQNREEVMDFLSLLDKTCA